MKRILVVLALALTMPRVAVAAEAQAAQAVKTTTKSSVQVQITDQAGITLLNIQANDTAVGAGGASQVLTGNVQSSIPTYTAGHIAMPTIDVGGRTYVTTDAAANLRTNITQVNGTTHSATAPIFSQLTDGTSTYIGAKSGQLPTSLGAQATGASLSIVPATGATFATTIGTPAGAASAVSAAVNIASGATTTITCAGSLTVSQPVKAIWVHVTGQSPAHCTIQYDSNASLTKWGAVEVGPSAPSGGYLPCTYGYCAVTAGSSGTQAIEASCTNLDSVANDFFCDVQYCSGASC